MTGRGIAEGVFERVAQCGSCGGRTTGDRRRPTVILVPVPPRAGTASARPNPLAQARVEEFMSTLVDVSLETACRAKVA